MAAPVEMHASEPSTRPKQWNSGTGRQTASSDVSRMPRATKRPLLTMLRCVSPTALGRPVVPDVNWMLVTSSCDSAGAAAGARLRSSSPSPREDAAARPWSRLRFPPSSTSA